MLGALAFQYIGGMAPCKLCIWQRWPHVVAIVIGLVALIIPARSLPLAGLLATLITAAVGAYHSGVEQGWWEGPSTCTSGSVSDLTTDELLAQIMAAPLVRCDEIPWQMLGLSMAGWNMVISIGLALIWFMASRCGRRSNTWPR